MVLIVSTAVLLANYNFQTAADPHNAKRGFFFAHIGWLFIKKHKNVYEAGKKLDFSDLANDPVVRFQKRFDPWFAQFVCFVAPGLLCMLWGDSFWHGYWVAGALRCVFVWHNTWLVPQLIYGGTDLTTLRATPRRTPSWPFWRWERVGTIGTTSTPSTTPPRSGALARSLIPQSC